MMRNRAKYGAGTVKGFRERLGEKIASRIEVPTGSLVVGVPNSGIPFADGLAFGLGVERTPLLLSRSQYQRSFQASTVEERKLRISDKLFINPELLDSVVGRDLVVIDDSIVRGNTSRAFVKMLRELDPGSITLISGYPPVINPCYFGVDLKKPEDFLLRIFLRTNKQIDMNGLAKYIGVDRLYFMSVEDLAAVDQEFRGKDAKLCFGCIDGQYPYPVDAEIEILQRAFNWKFSGYTRFYVWSRFNTTFTLKVKVWLKTDQASSFFYSVIKRVTNQTLLLHRIKPLPLQLSSQAPDQLEKKSLWRVISDQELFELKQPLQLVLQETKLRNSKLHGL